MSKTAEFLSCGLERARGAVVSVVGMADLQTGARDLTHGLLARASGRLRQVEAIVRRLIFLMALSVQLGPTAPRKRGGAGEPGLPAGLPEGTELAIFPRAYQHRLQLLPPRTPFAVTGQGWGSFGAVSVQSEDRSRAKPDPRRLIARIVAVQRVLAAPEAHARRLARSLKRLQAKGEPQPMIGPVESAFRLSPELGAIASLLPGMIRAGLESWESSG